MLLLNELSGAGVAWKTNFNTSYVVIKHINLR